MDCCSAILILAVAYIAYKYYNQVYSHWKSRGVPYVKPEWTIAVWIKLYRGELKMIDSVRTIYNEYEGKRYYGNFLFRKPYLVIRDKELLKKVTVKDFDHFVNRNAFVDEDMDPVLGRSLIVLQDDKWRSMRNTLSPAFTASKLRSMFPLIDQVGNQLTDHLDKLTKEAGGQVTLELKELFTKFTNDVIATAAFGLQVDTFKEPDNLFFKMGNSAINFASGWGLVRLTIITAFPKLAKTFGISFFGKEVNEFFSSIILNTLREREEKKIVRPDMIHLLLQARSGNLSDDTENLQRGKLPELTDLDIIAQALLFFFAGFDTSSTCLGFASYELAVNPEIQERLLGEIESVIENDGGKLTFEGVSHKMKYLDMVINETLRKWPAALITDRVVTKKYTIPHADDTPALTLNEGDLIWIPIYGIHRDPNIYPDPEKFDPERFSDENKDNTDQWSFLGFGIGPRHCIGKRFALLEVKLCLVHLLRKYEIKVVEQTPIPLEYRNDRGLSPQPKGGFTLGLRRRDTKS